MPLVFGEPLLFGLRFVAESEVFRKILAFSAKNQKSRFPVRTALTERDSSDSRTLPSAAKYENRLPYTIGSDPRRQRFVRGSDVGDRDVGTLGSSGQPMGDYGLGYIGIDRKVRTRCQRIGRPTTTGHDRGHYSPGNVSSDARSRQ